MAKKKGEPHLLMTKAAKIGTTGFGQTVIPRSSKMCRLRWRTSMQSSEISNMWPKENKAWEEKRLAPFLNRIKKGMDIGTKDPVYLAKLEADFGVKMTDEDFKYRDDQVKGPRKMYCQTFADKEWVARKERRDRENERLALAREKDAACQASLFSKVTF